MSKSPVQILKERFGDDRKAAKAKLVDAVRAAAGKDLWLERVNTDKGLEHVSNAKLLQLESVFTAIGKSVGSRAKLIDALAEAKGRAGDESYLQALADQSTPALWDSFQAAQRKAAKK